MNDLQVFQNEEFGQIRTVTFDGEPWFMGKEIAEVLGYERPAKAIADHVDDDEKREVPIRDSIGRMQNTAFINESGFYSLVLRSKLESAKRFKRWVTSEVLPSIRKTGSYSVHPADNEYLQAAKIVATCPPDRLQIVLSLLRNSGLIPAPQGRANPTEMDKLMIQSGMSTRELSRRTGICISSLSNYRRGLHRPTEERYQLILDTLTL